MSAVAKSPSCKGHAGGSYRSAWSIEASVSELGGPRPSVRVSPSTRKRWPVENETSSTTRGPRMTIARQGFGIAELDRHLGGGLLPGTLTVLAGATGAGKTQLGLRWANEGLAAEGHRGILCDLTSRGDAQNHAGY